MPQHLSRFLSYPAFVAAYLLFDWGSYLHPLFGLNITPWNPDPALGLVFWLHCGRKAALPWFVALVAGDALVRDLPAGPLLTALGALWLTLGYGLIGAALRRHFGPDAVFDDRRRLFGWVAIVAAGTLLNAVGYISLLWLGKLIPDGQWLSAVLRFGTGDMVGVLVSMPLIWILASADGRRRLREVVWQWDSAGYLALALATLWLVFGAGAGAAFKHFYFLFLPVIWAASRQGLFGTALVVFVLQLGIVFLFRWNKAPDIEIYELQLLDAMLALVGFFIGVVVDEMRQVADGLKQTLRLAAAGEMAAALAHELNQPLTALAAYGKACEYLLARGESGERLQNAIHRMIVESGRAADVVRRLRDFFRTGAMRLEPVRAAVLVAGITEQFAAQFQQQGVALTVREMPPVLLNADRLQIELVLRNLLANALDAVAQRPAGQRSITLSAATLSGARLRISVEDSGAGVSDSQAARLFQPFVSSKASGLGLGLVLSRAIVEAHGGSLWAEVAAHGVFRFVLPMVD